MRLRLDQRGNVVALGWDNIIGPTPVEEFKDLALGSPYKIAAAMGAQAQKKTRDDNARELAIKERKKSLDADAKAQRKYAAELKEYNEGFMVDVNGGVHPLMALAAIQTMAGAHSNPRHPLSGYALSTDGVPHHDRGMNGMGRSADFTAFGAVKGSGDFKARRLGRTGDFGGIFDDITSAISDVTETISDVTETVSDVTETYNQVQNVINPPAKAAPAPKVVVKAAPRAPATQGAPGSGILDSLWGPKVPGTEIPLVPVAAGTLIGLLLIMKQLRKS